MPVIVKTFFIKIFTTIFSALVVSLILGGLGMIFVAMFTLEITYWSLVKWLFIVIYFGGIIFMTIQTSYLIWKLSRISKKCNISFDQARQAVWEHNFEKLKPWREWDSQWLEDQCAQERNTAEIAKKLSDFMSTSRSLSQNNSPKDIFYHQ